MSHSLWQELQDSPILPELVEKAQDVLALEKARRAKFYEDITPEQKWEFIQGEVVMHSPALNRHMVATQHLFTLLNTYATVHRCGTVRLEKAMTSFPRNDYEPDIVFFGVVKSMGLQPDTLRFPVPDLIVEVLSPSTEGRDRGIKFQDYALHGVGEYWMLDPVAETVELHRPEAGAYLPAPRQHEGVLASTVVPGFQVSVRAIFDEAENLAALRSLLEGPSPARLPSALPAE